MMKATTFGLLAGLAQGEKCCETCADGLQKYYSVDMKHGHCGEACIKTSQFHLFKIFESNLTIADGSTGYSSCADLGWPKYSETVTHGDPLGLLTCTLDLYDHNGAKLSSGETCHLYEIQDDTCGQSDLDCAYTSPAKTFRKTLNDGTCAEHGYTVKTGEQTIKVPFLGDITATTYSKGAVLESGETCHLYEIQGDTCGQSDLDCAYTSPAKTFRKTLIDGTCAEQGYTVKTGEQTIKVPFLGDITATTYSKGAVRLPWLEDPLVGGCSNRGHCGLAYQTCCLGFQADGYPCGCKLNDGGSGESKGDCGDCGAAYQLCCAGYAADGYACTCDVTDGGVAV